MMHEQKVAQALKLLEQAQLLLRNQKKQNIHRSQLLLEESISTLKQHSKCKE